MLRAAHDGIRLVARRRRRGALLADSRGTARALTAARGQTSGLCAIFFFGSLFLCPATLPTLAPLVDEELKAESVDFEGGLEADAEVTVGHAVFVGVGAEEAKVTCNGKEEVVIPGREEGELVFEELGHFFGAGALFGDAGLGCFGEYFCREFAQPGFEH